MADRRTQPAHTAHDRSEIELHDQLLAFISDELGPDSFLEISGLERMTSGFSRENWSFTARWSDAGSTLERELILRRDPRGSVVETDRRIEFEALRALFGSAVPTPEAYWVDPLGDRLDRPSLIMRRYPGIGERFILTDGSLDLVTRLDLAATGLRHLVALHGSDWRAIAFDHFLTDPGRDAAVVAIAHWKAQLELQALEPQPELRSVCGWLERHAPDVEKTTIVHGDWKPGNWLVEKGRFVVALDWEMVHLGDPLEDLGWVTNPLRRTMHEIPGHFECQDIIDRYEEWSGRTVDEDQLRFWNIFSAFKIAIVELTGVRSFCRGLSDRVWVPDVRLYRYLLEEIGR